MSLLRKFKDFTLRLFFTGETVMNNRARIYPLPDGSAGLYGPDGFVGVYSRRRDAVRGAKRRGLVIA